MRLLRFPIVFVALAGLNTAPVWPASAPRILPGPPPVVSPRSSSPLRPISSPADVCGTRVEATAELLEEHSARVQAEPLPTPHSTDAGEIAVLEDDGTFYYLDGGGNSLVDLASVTRAFYRTHGDDYDLLAVYLSSGLNAWLGSATALAAAYPIRNAIQGIGLDAFDLGAGFGSPGRLQTVMSMNGLHRYPADPDEDIGGDTFSTMDVFLHELGHRWLAYVRVDSAGASSATLLGRDYQHWSFFFDSDSSLMEGCNWSSPAPDSFRTDGVSRGFGALDLYLMGLRSKAATDSFFVVDSPTAFDPPGTYIPITSPFVGLGCRGQAHFYSIDDVEAENGPRVPDASAAPHTFRVGVLLLTTRGSDATPSDLAKLESIRSRMAPDFASGTFGFGSIDATLDSHAGRVCIAHTPLADTEDPLSPRPLGARITIAQAGIPIALDPTSVRAWWRGPGGGPFSPIPLSAAGTDSFAGALPPLPPGGAAEYYLEASSDSAGIVGLDPPAGPLGPHAYFVGPDDTPPVIAHARIGAQAAARLPQTVLARVTDNLERDSVWIERSVDGGPTTSLATATAGRDSFAASLGAGLVAGQRIAYRFVARDRAAIPNLAFSNPAFDTLVVGTDWRHEFENGADGFTHLPQWYSFRDAWHLSTQDASPGGGTSWKCGATDSAYYAPHLDAYLATPTITGIVPGTTLRFDHRYDAEASSGNYAWDGLRIEIQQGAGAWLLLTPIGGYSHQFRSNLNPFQGTPCWSGNSGGWKSVAADLTPYGPGPVRVRFRMLTDNWQGGEGWFIDHVAVTFGSAPLDVPQTRGPIAFGIPWPNPSHGVLQLELSSERTTPVEWSLYDIAGRRVAVLWKGAFAAGSRELRVTLPKLAGGLYFSQVTLGGRERATHRVAVLR